MQVHRVERTLLSARMPQPEMLLSRKQACGCSMTARMCALRPFRYQAARSGGFVFLLFPAFAASIRIRLTRAVSCTRSFCARDASPAITDPAASANRNASAWSSKYRITCPDIRLLPGVQTIGSNFPCARMGTTRPIDFDAGRAHRRRRMWRGRNFLRLWTYAFTSDSAFAGSLPTRFQELATRMKFASIP